MTQPALLPLRVLLAAVLLAAPTAALAQSQGPIFDYSELALGVWAAVLREKRPFAITNSLIVISDDGVLVVDTQTWTPAALRQLAWAPTSTSTSSSSTGSSARSLPNKSASTKPRSSHPRTRARSQALCSAVC
jgi:hypothetical protein